MKILHVNNVYDYGSTGKLTAELHRRLMEHGIDSVVYYGRQKRSTAPNTYKICSEWYAKANNLRSRITGLMYGGCYISTRHLIQAIMKEKPDVVHLQCLNGYFVNIYKLITFLKKHHIPTVLTLHAEFMYTANCGYALDCNRWQTGCGYCPRLRQATKSYFLDRTATSWKNMKQAFNGFSNLQLTSVSPWLKERAAQAPILQHFPNQVIYNGVNTEVFHPMDTTQLRKQLGIPVNTSVLFYAAPFFDITPDSFKGGHHIVELAKRLGPQVQILVAGRYNRSLNYPANIKLLGYVSNQQQLAAYYALADITVLTSKKETFSMICAESLCCGTPVVGFEAGAPEQISLSQYSKFCKYGDITTLTHFVQETAAHLPSRREVALQAQQVYSLDTMVKQFINCYHNLMEKSHAL